MNTANSFFFSFLKTHTLLTIIPNIGIMKSRLFKKIILQVMACLKDKGRFFSIEEVMTESSSRSTAYRYVKLLREENVLKQIGREKYTVTDNLRRRVVEEIR